MEQERTETVFLSVTPHVKRQIEAAKDNKELQLSIVKEMFELEKNWLKQELQQMDDDLLQYRALLLKMREAYKEAQQEHYNKVNDLWDEISKSVPSFTKKVESLVKELEPVTIALTAIKNQTDSVNTWKAKEIIEMVNLVSNMTPEKIEMFNLLVNYSKESK